MSKSYRHVPQADLKYFIREATKGIGGSRFGFILEALQNSLVAGATKFIIVTLGRGASREIWFVDDGRGMEEGKPMDSFLDLALSPFRGVETVRSDKGYGRFTNMHKMNHLEAYNRPDGLDPAWVYKVEFDWDDLLDQYGKPNAKSFEWKLVPAQEENFFLPEGSDHGVCIKLTNPVENSSIPSAKAIVQELGNKLPPFVVDMIQVYDGETFLPLAKRSLTPEEHWLCYEEPNRADLGYVYVDLYQRKKRSSGDDLYVGWVQHGSKGCVHGERLMPWQELLRNCPEDCWDPELDIIGISGVSGDLLCERFMPFRSGQGEALDDRFYTSKVFADFRTYLSVHVAKPIYDRLNVIQTEERKKQEEDLREFLTEFLGEGPGPYLPKLLQIAGAKEIHLISGEKHEFTILRQDPSIRQVEWSLTPAVTPKPSLMPRIGKAVIFTAPKIDQGTVELTLVAQDVDNSKTRDEVKIHVTRQRQLSIKPKTPTVAPGHRITFEAVHYQDLANAAKEGRDLKWRIEESGADGGFVAVVNDQELLSDTATGPIVQYQAGAHECPEGYPVELRILNTQHIAKTSLSVMNRVPTTTPPHGGSGKGIKLEDVSYNIQSRRIPNDGTWPVVGVTLRPGGKVGTAEFNLEHPAVKHLAGNRMALHHKLMTYFVMGHVTEKSGRTLRADELLRRTRELETQIQERHEARRDSESSSGDKKKKKELVP